MYAALVLGGYGADPVVRAWFDFARRAETERTIDASGWPVLSTRDTITLIREWGKTLRDVGEVIAWWSRTWRQEASWQQNGRRVLGAYQRRSSGEDPSAEMIESVNLWVAGAYTTAAVCRWTLELGDEDLSAAALAGIEQLAAKLEKRSGQSSS
jgi:hypothetical protein